MNDTTGYYTYDDGDGFLVETMTLAQADAEVRRNWYDAVQYDAGDSVWFYEDQRACDRDEDGMTDGEGIVGTWSARNPYCIACGTVLDHRHDCPRCYENDPRRLEEEAIDRAYDKKHYEEEEALCNANLDA